jgi:hypothetical protein
MAASSRSFSTTAACFSSRTSSICRRAKLSQLAKAAPMRAVRSMGATCTLARKQTVFGICLADQASIFLAQRDDLALGAPQLCLRSEAHTRAWWYSLGQARHGETTAAQACIGHSAGLDSTTHAHMSALIAHSRWRRRSRSTSAPELAHICDGQGQPQRWLTWRECSSSLASRRWIRESSSFRSASCVSLRSSAYHPPSTEMGEPSVCACSRAQHAKTFTEASRRAQP